MLSGSRHNFYQRMYAYSLVHEMLLFQLTPALRTALAKVYFDSSRGASFTSNLKQLQQEVRKELPSVRVTQAVVKKFLQSEPKIRIGAARRRRFRRVPFYAKTVDACWAGGLFHCRRLL